MKQMLSKREENKYDDKATCGKEQAFLIAKRQACLLSLPIRLAAHHTIMRGL